MAGSQGAASLFTLDWTHFAMVVAAIGALGTASFGIVESLGKAFAFTFTKGRDGEGGHGHFGLPYFGLSRVKAMARPLAPALKCAYGDDYADIIAEKYRAGRSAGSAPDTIRQGVRLGLPFLGVERAQAVIAAVWDMDPQMSRDLAVALQALPTVTPGPQPPWSPPSPIDPAQALAGRFATALDARIDAAFAIAEEQYETAAKTWAGVAAVALAIGLSAGLAGRFELNQTIAALGVGLVAVPLAPVAKDLSTSLQNALTAVKTIAGKGS